MSSELGCRIKYRGSRNGQQRPHTICSIHLQRSLCHRHKLLGDLDHGVHLGERCINLPFNAGGKKCQFAFHNIGQEQNHQIVLNS